jgi:hypothetical protein
MAVEMAFSQRLDPSPIFLIKPKMIGVANP